MTKALAAGDDYDAFNASGGGAFLEHLVDLIEELNSTVSEMAHSVYETAMGGAAQVAEPVERIASSEPAESRLDVEPDVAMSHLEAETPSLLAEDTQSDSAEDELAAFGMTEPVNHVESDLPIESVESVMPIEDQPKTPEAAPRIVPKRVRPTGDTQSSRPRRPSAKPQVVAFDPDINAPEMRPEKQSNPNQLRAIFSSESDASEDAAASR